MNWNSKYHRLVSNTLLIAAIVVACLFVVPHPVHGDGNPCAGADYLLEAEDFEAAKTKYLELLSKPEAVDCAIAGLKKLKEAQEAKTQAQPESVALLRDDLTVVGIQSCPTILPNWLRSWFRCQTRYEGLETLAIPLSTEIFTTIEEVDDITALLVNADSGDMLTLKTGELTTVSDLAVVAVEVSDVETGNGTYSGSLDLLPADKDKGEFTLELKLRDSIWWVILTVLLGVFISTVVRITYNKWHPLRFLDGELDRLLNRIEQGGVSAPVKDPQDQWDRRLKGYSIVEKSSGRVEKLREELGTLVRDQTVASLAATSEDAAVKDWYERKKAEESLLEKIRAFAQKVQFPAHWAFKGAKEEAKQIDVGLLTLAENELYRPEDAPSPPAPEPVNNNAELSALQDKLMKLADLLTRAKLVLFRVRRCISLKKAIEDQNGLDPDQKKMFDKAKAELANVTELLKQPELDGADFYRLATRLDKTMDILQTLVEALAEAERIDAAAWADARRVPVEPAVVAPVAPAVREITEKAVQLLYPWYLAFKYYVPIPNLISLVLALAFALTTEYFTKTFGTPSDYISAFAWGLGIDTATKTIPSILSGLGLSKS